MKRKFWNWVRNEGEKHVLLLDGEISDETWWGDEVTPQMFRSELNAAQRVVQFLQNRAHVFHTARQCNHLVPTGHRTDR